MALGCVGVFYTDRQQSLFELGSPSEGGCRRYDLTFTPDAMCAGDFNGDRAIDVAITDEESDKLYVMAGDGFGGLLDPPAELPLPAPGAKGGPITCGRIDGDDKDDVVVVNKENGDVYIMRTGG
jgi:hypothetical protein